MPNPRPSNLEQRVEIETPEHVAFSYTVAGIGSRAAAAITDFFIVWGIVAGLYLVAILVAAGLRGMGIGGGIAALTGAWLLAVLYLVYFALNWGYAVFFEALADGQTPGKKRLGLRVVQDGGYSISFPASAVRNFVRILDAQPGFFYAVGMASALFSKAGKRVGDHVAGTLVVHECAPDFAPALALPPQAEGDAALPIAAHLTDDEFSLLQRFMTRRQALDPARRSELTAQLATRFHGRLPAEGSSDGARLLRLYQAEHHARARGVAARGVTGAQREQHALVARSAGRWAEFAALLERARKGGLRALPEADVADFVARYRELATDLARLRTATRGGESEALYYVSRLVAAGHNLLYRRREVALHQFRTFLSVSLPREVRRSWAPVLAAAVLLFGPAIATCVSVVRDPDLAYDLLPAGMVDRVETAARNDSMGGGYIKTNELQRPIVASTIMANNIQVTTLAFAAGATAGLGTAFVLVMNGISLGAGIGAYATHGVAHIIFGFVIAHGVLELTAICLGAGGGLLIGKAILLPGALTRREALVHNGRRAVKLATTATILLVFAGLIEGLFSADPFWPLPHRVFVGALSGVVMLVWLTRGWRGEADLPDEINAYSAARPFSSR